MICVAGNGIVRAVETRPKDWLPVCLGIPSVEIEERILVHCCATTRNEASEYYSWEVVAARMEGEDALKALWAFEQRLQDEYDGQPEQFAELAAMHESTP